ncbi:MAG: hypothetical protein ACTSQK_02205 [Candidatus Heimdallarchaeota archaeon]
MDQYDPKKLTQCLNELAKVLQICKTTQKLTEETVSVIRNYLFYDAVAVHLFNLEQKLQLRANYGINIQKEIEKTKAQDYDIIIKNLSEQKLLRLKRQKRKIMILSSKIFQNRNYLFIKIGSKDQSIINYYLNLKDSNQ